MTACLKNSSDPVQELDDLVLLSPALLWMIPAFCFCSQFLDPLDTHERSAAIQRTRVSHEASFTDDIWDKDLIHDWAGSDGSQLLLLQGNSQTSKRLERFAIEIIRAINSSHLGQPVRIVYILNAPQPQGTSSRLDPSGLLQQVAVQCLQYVRPKGPVGFLMRIFKKFQQANTSRHWFGILQDICVLIPSLYIIINLAILGPNHEELQSWPAQIQDLFNYLEEFGIGCCLKVMLLNCRKSISQVDATLVIKALPASSTFRKRHKTSKVLRKVIEDPDLTSFNHREKAEAAGVPQDPPVKAKSPSPSGGTISGEALITTPERLPHTIDLEIESPCLPEPRDRNDFKIAIICALTLESDAVQDSFDNRWDEFKYGKTPGDPNQYTTGIIGRHNVVVVHMPGMGKGNGASAAANCRTSFPNLGLVLVVGICGGVPFPKSGVEIVLGDVIISDALIQYDLGRQFPDRFVRKHDTITRPNSEILSFLAKMKGRWGMKRLREQTAVHLKYLRHATDMGAMADYPGAWKDKLYEPTYRHKHQAASKCGICNICQTNNDPVCEEALTFDCESLQCNDGHLISRQRLASLAGENKNQKTNAQPMIHFGLYASGDKVMKSGEEREMIAKKEGVIAFEMEGSGVCEGFPGRCLVVKAVCDYADSHKNKRWQNYAAASAAACTKALLESWST